MIQLSLEFTLTGRHVSTNIWSTKLNLQNLIYESLNFETVYFISDFKLHLWWYFSTSCYKVRSFDQILTI